MIKMSEVTENKENLTGNGKRHGKIWIPIAAAALIALGAAAFFLTGKESSSSTASVSAASGNLAAQLASEGTGVIRVDEDVVLEGLSYVNGEKTLEGTGTVTIAGSEEYILVVNEGATLNLDGPTLKGGDTAVNGIYVSPNAVLNYVSGNLQDLAGHGIRVLGSASLNDVAISNVGTNWLMVDTGADAAVTTASFSQAGDIGILSAEGSRVTLGQGVTLTGAKSNLLYNGGTMTLEGGNYSDSDSYFFHNAGTMTLKDVDLSGAQALGYIENAEGAALTVTGGSMTDSKADLIYNKGTASLTRLQMDGCSSTAIESRGSYASLEMTDCSMDNIGGTAVNGKTGTVTIQDCTMGTVGKSAVVNTDGVLKVDGLTVGTCGAYGIHNSEGQAEIRQLEIERTENIALFNDTAFSGTLTVTGFNIGSAGNYGIRSSAGTLKLTDGTVGLCDSYGLYIKDGTAETTHCSFLGTTDTGRCVVQIGLENVTTAQVTMTSTNVTGGARGITNRGTLTYNSGEITGNVSAGDTKVGAGISNSGTLYLNGGKIYKNKAASSGGGVYNTGTCEISGDVSIWYNRSAASGGGVANGDGGTMTISGGKITGNVANNYGGGVFNKGTLVVTDGFVGGNTAGKGGGGIENTGKTTLSGGEFSWNQSDGAGGGVYNGTTGTMTMNGVVVSYNSSDEASSGGGVFNLGCLNIQDKTSIHDNTAGTYGGGISNSISTSDSTKYGTLTMVGGTVKANYTLTKGGGGIYNTGKATITGGSVIENWLKKDGQKGANIYCGGTHGMTITGGTMNGNDGEPYDIYIYKSELSLSGAPVIDSILRSSQETAKLTIADALTGTVTTEPIQLYLPTYEADTEALNGTTELIKANKACFRLPAEEVEKGKYIDDQGLIQLYEAKLVKDDDSTEFGKFADLAQDTSTGTLVQLQDVTLDQAVTLLHDWNGQNYTLTVSRSVTVEKNLLLSAVTVANAEDYDGIGLLVTDKVSELTFADGAIVGSLKLKGSKTQIVLNDETRTEMKIILTAKGYTEGRQLIVRSTELDDQELACITVCSETGEESLVLDSDGKLKKDDGNEVVLYNAKGGKLAEGKLSALLNSEFFAQTARIELLRNARLNQPLTSDHALTICGHTDDDTTQHILTLTSNGSITVGSAGMTWEEIKVSSNSTGTKADFTVQSGGTLNLSDAIVDNVENNGTCNISTDSGYSAVTSLTQNGSLNVSGNVIITNLFLSSTEHVLHVTGALSDASSIRINCDSAVFANQIVVTGSQSDVLEASKAITTSDADYMVDTDGRYVESVQAMLFRSGTKVSQGSFLAMRNVAQSGDEIVLKKNFNLATGTSNASLDTANSASVDNLTIDGAGHTITIGASSLTISADGTKVKNLTVTASGTERTKPGIQIGTSKVATATATFENVTVIAITGNVSGAGIANYGTLTMNSCLIKACTSDGKSGAGVYNAGTLKANDCSFQSNTAQAGGAVYSTDKGSLTMENCTISSCTARGTNGGGAVYAGKNGATLTGCTITACSSDTYAGAIRCKGGNLTLTDCTFQSNTCGNAKGQDICCDGVVTLSGSAAIPEIYAEAAEKVYLAEKLADGSQVGIRLADTLFTQGTVVLTGKNDAVVKSAVQDDAVQVLNAGDTSTLYLAEDGTLQLREAALLDEAEQIVACGDVADLVARTDGTTIELLKNVTLADELSVTRGLTFTGGKTLAAPDGITVNTQSTVNLKNISISTGSGYMTLAAGDLALAGDVTLDTIKLSDGTKLTLAEVLGISSSVKVLVENASEGKQVIACGGTTTTADLEAAAACFTVVNTDATYAVGSDGKLIVANASYVSAGKTTYGTLEAFLALPAVPEEINLLGNVTLTSMSVPAGSKLKLNGSGSTITFSDGGLITAGALTLNGIEIAGDSGIVVTSTGNLSLNGCTVYAIANNGTLTMTGANTITTLADNGTLSLSGTPEIETLSLSSGKTVALAGNVSSGSSIGIALPTSLAEPYGTIIYTGDAAALKSAAECSSVTSHDGYLVDYDGTVCTDSEAQLWTADGTKYGKDQEGTLSDILAGSNSGDIIKLRKDVANAAGLAVDGKNVQIEGQSYEIAAASGKKLFTVSSGAKLTLNNLKLIGGGKTVAAGGPAINNKGTLIVSNATISDFSSQKYAGGAIYNTGTATLSNVIFDSNKTVKSGDTVKSGGAIYISGTGNVTCNACEFKNNQSSENGGAIYNGGSLTVSNGSIIGNTADKNGGAIYNTGTLTVNGGSYTGNTASGNGGAVYNTGTLTVNSGSIIDNSASGNGGGIYNYSSSDSEAELTIIEATVTGNAGGSNGKDIYIASNSTGIITAGEFENVYIYCASGSSSSLSIQGGSFGVVNKSKSNTAITISGGIYKDSPAGTIADGYELITFETDEQGYSYAVEKKNT